MTLVSAYPTAFRLPLWKTRVCAILSGNLTQVRLPIQKAAPGRARWREDDLLGPGWHRAHSGECVFGTFAQGDKLIVTESWAVGQCADDLPANCLSPEIWMKENGGPWYEAGGLPSSPISPRGRWRTALEMPVWASRIQLQVSKVRIGPVEATDEDALAEGVVAVPGGWSWRSSGYPYKTPREAARMMWEVQFPMLPWGSGLAVSIISVVPLPSSAPQPAA